MDIMFLIYMVLMSMSGFLFHLYMTAQEQNDSLRFKIGEMTRKLKRGDNVSEVVEQTRQETIKMILEQFYEDGLIEYASYKPKEEKIVYQSSQLV